MAQYTSNQILISNNNGLIQGRNSLNYGFPRGTVLMWYSNTIPPGWVECNGQNNSPDLRGRFPVGVGSEYALGNTGGMESVILKDTELPSHIHSGKTNDVSYGRDSYGVAETIFFVEPHTAKDEGTHTHTFTTDATGGSQPHNNMPPYYVLRFIMKT